MTSAECNTRSVELANVTFSSPHAKQIAIDGNIAMSLPMHLGNAGIIVNVGTWAHDLSDCKSRPVMVEQQMSL